MSSTGRPFHILMAATGSNQPQQEQLLKDQRIQSDYLSRRYEATMGEKQKELWSAASPVERALADCCELDGDESLDVVVEGALMIRKVIHFVELLAKYCYKVSLRILVISILERTLEQDSLNREEAEEDGREPRPNCVSRFLAAGGLKILNQWLTDAITPTSVKQKETKPPTKRQRTAAIPETLSEDVTSANGPLLMSLLTILERIPFNKALVQETRVNKTIRRIKKQISNLPKRSPDPLAGGYVVNDVLKAIDSLMERWKESMNDDPPAAKDPLRTLHQTMQERLTVLKAYEAGDAEKPEWFEAFEETERLAKARKDLSKLSPAERDARRALEEAQRKREEASKKVEELKKKRQNTTASKKTGPKKKVRWRDGKNQGLWAQQHKDIYYYEPEVDREAAAAEAAETADNDDEDMW
eukprot:CAMPEP_0119005916 /NCGR_PEP_ID=MMETSP1176-20130426/2004_1 /TAXON_ID=265551 /ORGANISM="Synedropsis recta cf, Strain CCMP1620" /LENGTH=414 /DNA_ID=CAMNT_0006957775 /DNA_START=76 /DNA_END=1317 /DNA_ORIENTATION=+